MFMRNCYVVLSGIITAAAVLGWCQVCSDGQATTQVVEHVAAPAQSQESEVPQIIPIEDEAPKAAAEPISWLALDKLNGDVEQAVSQNHINQIVVLTQIASDDKVVALNKPAETAPIIKLATPDAFPLIGEAGEGEALPPVSAADLFGIFKNDERMQSSNLLAVVDASSQKVLESTRPDANSAIEERLTDIADNWVLYVENGIYKRTTWHCLDSSMTRCLLSDDNVLVKLPADQKCAAAQQLNLSLNEETIDAAALLDAKSCPKLKTQQEVSQALAGFDNDSGTWEIDGKSYEYARTAMEDGLSITSVLPPADLADEVVEETPAVVQAPVVVPNPKDVETAPQIGATPQKKAEVKSSELLFGYKIQDLGFSCIAGLVMMIFGFAATRRKEEEKAKDSDADKEPSKKLESKDSEDAGKDSDAPRKLVSGKVTEKSEPEQESEASHAEPVADSAAQDKKDVQEIDKKDVQEIDKKDIQVVESEPSHKEDAAPADQKDKSEAGKVSVTETEKKSEPAENKDAVQELDKDAVQELDKDAVQELDKDAVQEVGKDILQKLDEDNLDAVLDSVISGEHPKNPSGQNVNRITAQATEKVTELVAQDNANAFFEALEEDNWDELADSFDAIMLPGQKNIENVELKPSLKTQSPIQGSALGSLLENETDEGESSSFGMSGFLSAIQKDDVRGSDYDSGIHTEVRMKSVAQDKPKLNSMPKVEVPNAALRVSEDVRGNTMSGMSPRMTMPMAAAIKPSVPELQGGAMDQNSLYDALKRRARDVSEMASSQSKVASSGAFEFNRGISKSGLFSVTGSRVDIDPSSDNEYFKTLYNKFVATQKECGEPADKLTLEQFVSRMAREKDNLIKRFNCKNVKFSVYVKDGKASIKAIPQK